MMPESYSTQILGDLDVTRDYSTRRLILIQAFKRMQEIERGECAAIAESVRGEDFVKDAEHPTAYHACNKIAQAIRQRA